ncbi:glycosyltransferase involved in cell wall biosynthesis [Lacibacter cauensis]|uniref:Glycosyltransferase involved in cell wall biosynthesis n=1 Tax=Lacibacter cauensis TaxID=510947 RepID=A0A562SWN1_9BACT|nr:glycosyltransferase [Lacibacter cauensis]TWI85661.1 glycosyltransferase involved in cell wall biosynthesis [Lacibacter cauensis]
MKVLWLCSWYPNSADPFDGDFIERHAKALALYHQVDVMHVVQNKHFLKGITSIKKEERNTTNLNASIYFLPLPNTGFAFVNVYLFNKRYQAFYKQLIEQYIAINGKPDLVHVHVPVKAGLTAVLLNRKYNVPFVVTEHSSAYFEYIPENYFSRNRYFRFVTKQTFSKALAVSTVSNWLLKRLQFLFSVQQTKLIRNVVDTNLFYPVVSDRERLRFIHVSMMHPLKNVEGILRALALLKEKRTDWEIWFVGPASKENRALTETLGLTEQVQWKGTLPYADVAAAMRAADALVHFSNYENLPCVVNEALCCGLPVISSSVGGIAEIVNATNGVLVTAGNINELTAALAEFLQYKNRYNKNKIAAEAATLFNEKEIGKQLNSWYAELLAKK